MKTITPDMKVGDILDMNPGLDSIFLSHGLHCLGCPASSAENLEEAAASHAIDLQQLVEDLNKANEC